MSIAYLTLMQYLIRLRLRMIRFYISQCINNLRKAQKYIVYRVSRRSFGIRRFCCERQIHQKFKIRVKGDGRRCER